MQAETRVKADQFIAEMKKKRDEFEGTVKKQAEAGEAAWDSAKVRLETEWKGFQAETEKYLETFGKGIEQQQAVFQSQVTAQLNAWRETADKLNAAGKEFAHRAPAGNRCDRLAHEGRCCRRGEKAARPRPGGNRILVRPQRRLGRNARHLRSRKSGRAGGVQTRLPVRPNNRTAIVWRTSRSTSGLDRRLQTQIERENVVPADSGIVARTEVAPGGACDGGGSVPRSPRIGPQNPPMGQLRVRFEETGS